MTGNLAADKFSAGNEAFADEDYDLAIQYYTEAINLDGENGAYYLKRCNARLKKEDFGGALDDANMSIKLNSGDGRAFQRKGSALFFLEDFDGALDAFKRSLEFDANNEQIKQSIRKCEAEINLKEVLKKNTEETQRNKTLIGLSNIHKANEKQDEVPPSITDDKTTVVPTSLKTKYDWYQTETHVIISILIKNIKEKDVSCHFGDKTLSVTIKLSQENDYSLELDLSQNIVPHQSLFQVFSTKLEIKMKKESGIRWDTLEEDHTKITVIKSPSKSDTVNPHKYPSSSHFVKNWDLLAKQVEEEEKNENKEGDGALNALFQQIYADGSDEVKRAMNKSFQESGGTVLSTNWNEISKEKVEIKPPDCMEYKKYEY
ncbi:protein SGT1 homolog isoform X1 [Hydra vulgaris]|uniref:Suppressor of G2 allele of SKP1 homolog n=1 Tax=Hydra vulgaris TaxID=6087 RepID=T2M2Z0_HYDVU|nr:protein SGT1 homolog [Hydra vulgaris]